MAAPSLSCAIDHAYPRIYSLPVALSALDSSCSCSHQQQSLFVPLYLEDFSLSDTSCQHEYTLAPSSLSYSRQSLLRHHHLHRYKPSPASDYPLPPITTPTSLARSLIHHNPDLLPLPLPSPTLGTFLPPRAPTAASPTASLAPATPATPETTKTTAAMDHPQITHSFLNEDTTASYPFFPSVDDSFSVPYPSIFPHPHLHIPSGGREGFRSVPLPGIRCPTCAKEGKEVWVIPGRACGYCGTECVN